MKRFNAKKITRTFFLLAMTLALAMSLSGFAFADGVATAAAPDINQGLGLIAAAVAMGVSAIGSGIAVGASAPAAIGALTEDAKSFGKALIFVALGEGIALYGMLVAILIWTKV